MRAGRLRHLVTLLRPVGGGRDQYGQPTDDYEPVDTIWASVEPLRGREFFDAQQTNAEVTTRIRCRYRADLAAPEASHWRIEYAGRVYEIDGPPINSRMEHRQLEIMCHELV